MIFLLCCSLFLNILCMKKVCNIHFFLNIPFFSPHYFSSPINSSSLLPTSLLFFPFLFNTLLLTSLLSSSFFSYSFLSSPLLSFPVLFNTLLITSLHITPLHFSSLLSIFADADVKKISLLCGIIFCLHQCNNKRIEKIPNTMFNNTGIYNEKLEQKI